MDAGTHSVRVVFVAGQDVHASAALGSLNGQLATGRGHLQHAVAGVDLGLVEHGGDAAALRVVQVETFHGIRLTKPGEINTFLVRTRAGSTVELSGTSGAGGTGVELYESLWQLPRDRAAALRSPASKKLPELPLEGLIHQGSEDLREGFGGPLPGHVSLCQTQPALSDHPIDHLAIPNDHVRHRAGVQSNSVRRK